MKQGCFFPETDRGYKQIKMRFVLCITYADLTGTERVMESLPMKRKKALKLKREYESMGHTVRMFTYRPSVGALV